MLALKKNVDSDWETKILNCGGILKARGWGYDVVSVKETENSQDMEGKQRKTE